MGRDLLRSHHAGVFHCLLPNAVKRDCSHFHPHQRGFRPSNLPGGKEADVHHLVILWDFGQSLC